MGWADDVISEYRKHKYGQTELILNGSRVGPTSDYYSIHCWAHNLGRNLLTPPPSESDAQIFILETVNNDRQHWIGEF